MTVFRKACEADIPALTLLYREAGWLTAEADGSFMAVAMRNSHWTVAVDEVSGVVGSARALCDHASDCYIQDVVVAEKFRKRGIASELVRRLTAEVRSEGVDWIGLVGVPGTGGLYAGCGFEPLPGHTAMKLKDF
ncbi:MAG: GNAT family N-acetyltransferase [Victivallaceae bacterium]|nr:GNAT family N-acetyltransferase [Victivallaceae bacterium]